MISDTAVATMESLGLMLEQIHFSSVLAHVSVGIRDSAGNRWIGRAINASHDPCEGLERAFYDALQQFNPYWREHLGKAVQI